MATIERKKKNGVGALEAELLALIHDLDAPGIDLDTAGRLIPGVPRRAIHAGLRRLVDKGHLRRLARALYYPKTADPSRAACHAYAPAYVSLLTRLQDEGYTTQIPRRLDLAYARRQRRTAGWGDLPITWHPIPPRAFQGYAARPDGVLQASAAKAAADLVHRQKAFGGLTPHLAMVTQALRDAPRDDLEEAMNAYETTPGTLRRLIHILAPSSAPPSVRRLASRLDVHNPIPLDLVRPDGKPGGPMNIRTSEVPA